MGELREEGRGQGEEGGKRHAKRVSGFVLPSTLFPLPSSLPLSMIRQKLAAIQQGPKRVPEGDAFVAAGFRSVRGDHLLEDAAQMRRRTIAA